MGTCKLYMCINMLGHRISYKLLITVHAVIGGPIKLDFSLFLLQRQILNTAIIRMDEWMKRNSLQRNSPHCLHIVFLRSIQEPHMLDFHSTYPADSACHPSKNWLITCNEQLNQEVHQLSHQLVEQLIWSANISKCKMYDHKRTSKTAPKTAFCTNLFNSPKHRLMKF